MSNPLLATTDDLAARLGLTFTDDEVARADVLLDITSGLVRQSARQTITLVTDDVLDVPGNFSDRILLPQRPVVDVSQVTFTFRAGSTLVMDPLAYYVDRDELVRYAFPVGIVPAFRSNIGWFGPSYTIGITYTHGYALDAVPALARTIALEAAVRAWVNPAGASQTIIGGVQEQYLNGTGLRLTPDEEKQLADAFRRTAGTVNLR